MDREYNTVLSFWFRSKVPIHANQECTGVLFKNDGTMGHYFQVTKKKTIRDFGFGFNVLVPVVVCS